MNRSDTNIWIGTAVSIVALSFLAGYVFAKGIEPTTAPCQVVMSDGAGVKHQWMLECESTERWGR